jgi:hypothetical protein
MIDVEPQPRIDTLVRSGQTGAIVDAAATFTDDWPTWIQVHVNGHLGVPGRRRLPRRRADAAWRRAVGLKRPRRLVDWTLK